MTTTLAERRPIPPMAWVLSGAVAIALTVLAAGIVSRSGIDAFFSKSQADGFFFKLTAQDPLGRARAFAAVRQLPEAPYRYGRIGLPALGWLLALGRPAWVVWSMLGIYVASIAAIPGIAAVLLDDLGAPPGAGLVVLLAPGIMLNNGHVYADPLLIALCSSPVSSRAAAGVRPH